MTSQRTSEFSSVNIGLSKGRDPHAAMREHFKQEAQEVFKATKNIHHTRKDPHMVNECLLKVLKIPTNQYYINSTQQTQYANTVQIMSSYLQERTAQRESNSSNSGTIVATPSSTLNQTSSTSAPANYKEYVAKMNKSVHEEYNINDRKRRYNKEMGRKACVDEIMTGTGT